MRFRFIPAAVLAAAFGVATATAGPLVIENTARLIPPLTKYGTAHSVAIDVNRAIVAASVSHTSTSYDVGAFLYQRDASGQWALAASLLDDPVTTADSGCTDWCVLPVAAAIQGDLAAIAWPDHIAIFERNGTTWTRTADLTPQASLETGRDIAIEGGRILVSGTAKGLVFIKNTAGQWTQEAQLPVGTTGFQYGEDLDLGGNVATLVNGMVDPSAGKLPEVALYERTGTQWNHAATLTAPAGDPANFGHHTSTDGTNLLVSNGWRTGVHAYKRVGGVWTLDRTLRPLDALALNYDLGVPGYNPNSIANGLVVVGRTLDHERQLAPGSVLLYDLNAGPSEHPVARLVEGPGRPVIDDPEEAFQIGRHVDISGRQAIASSPGGALIFDLPTSFGQPANVQDDFLGGSAAQWTPVPGGSFSVAPGASGSLVYRQSSTAGDAISIRGNTDWTNQSIQADITPTAFDGIDRWFGLIVRYIDPDNYYYATVRNGTNRVQLKRKINGQFVTLDEGGAPIVEPNTMYRLRLEAIGSVLRLMINDATVAEVFDTSPTHGRAGVMTYKAAADYDNVVITPNPRSTLAHSGFGMPDAAWTPTSGAWTMGGGQSSYRQTSTTGDARTSMGIPTDDQSMLVMVHPVSYGTEAGSHWFGAAVRYQDDNNYYYLTLRSNNEVSLRKLSNGTITVLDTAPFTITLNPGKWYRLKLEAVGNKIRGYVDGQFLVEATDSTFPNGKFAFVGYRAAADYADFHVYQP